MQERLQRVPLYMYMFAISLIIVAMVSLSLFTTSLAGIVVLMCALRVCEQPAGSSGKVGITTIVEEPSYPSVPQVRAKRQALPRTAPETPAAPEPELAIKLHRRITDQATNGRGLRVPSNGGTFVLEVTEDNSATQPALPSRQQQAAAIAEFFNRGSAVAVKERPAIVPVLAQAPTHPRRQEPGEPELLYYSTRSSYLAQKPSAAEVVVDDRDDSCSSLSADELERLQGVLAASSLAYDQANAEFQLLLDEMADLGCKPAPSKAKDDFASYTHKMLIQLDAGGRALDRTLEETKRKAQREWHEANLATSVVMERDLYDYMPGPFSTIPRVRGCPTPPSTATHQQMNAGYRAAGSDPSA